MKKFNKASDNKPSQVKKKKITRPPLNERKEIRRKKGKMLGTKKGAPGTNRRVPRTKPEFVSDAQRKAVWASKKDGGKGNPNKKKKKNEKTC